MSTKQTPAKAPEYAISEIVFVNGLTSGIKWVKNGQGYDVTECTETRGGYWVVDQRGPKWWIPSTNVVSCKYDVVPAAAE